MSNVDFNEWAAAVRAQLQKAIHDHTARTGKYPVAILADGKCMHAVYREPEKRNIFTTENVLIWHGIPFIRCGLINKVVLVSDMEEIAFFSWQSSR